MSEAALEIIPSGDVKPGDFITVDHWLSRNDNSYRGETLEVLDISGGVARVHNHTFSVFSPFTLDMTRVAVRRMDADFQRRAELYAESPTMAALLEMIINDLPSNRDWLDPAIEREARACLARIGRGK